MSETTWKEVIARHDGETLFFTDLYKGCATFAGPLRGGYGMTFCFGRATHEDAYNLRFGPTMVISEDLIEYGTDITYYSPGGEIEFKFENEEW